MCTPIFRVGVGAAEKELGCESWGVHMDMQGPLLRGGEKGKEHEGPSVGWLSPCCHIPTGNSEESKHSIFKPPRLSCRYFCQGRRTEHILFIFSLIYNFMIFRHTVCGLHLSSCLGANDTPYPSLPPSGREGFKPTWLGGPADPTC